MALIITGMGSSFTSAHRSVARKTRRSALARDAEHESAGGYHEDPHPQWTCEQSRVEIAAATQAIQAAETARQIVEIAGAGLAAIREQLEQLRIVTASAARLADLRAAENDDDNSLSVQSSGAPLDYRPYHSALEASRDRIGERVNQAMFGQMRLLDGGLGCTGMAFGQQLSFVRGSPQCRSSSPEGYPVWIRQGAHRAETLLNLQAWQQGPQADQPLLLCIGENGSQVDYTAQLGESPAELAAGLQQVLNRAGLQVEVALTDKAQLRCRHKSHGSAYRFTISSNPPGVCAHPQGDAEEICNGRDVSGSIGGEAAQGEGQLLTGCAGNRRTAGLTVRYTGQPSPHNQRGLIRESLERVGLELSPEEAAGGELVGRVILVQRPFLLRLGAGEDRVVRIQIDSMHPTQLGRGVETTSGFGSLAEVSIYNDEQARSTDLVVAQAQAETERNCRHVARLRDSVLAESLSRLRKDTGQRISSTIADAQGAQQVAYDLRHRMLNQGPSALQAQLQPLPGAMLRLLTDEGAQTMPGHLRG